MQAMGEASERAQAAAGRGGRIESNLIGPKRTLSLKKIIIKEKKKKSRRLECRG